MSVTGDVETLVTGGKVRGEGGLVGPQMKYNTTTTGINAHTMTADHRKRKVRDGATARSVDAIFELQSSSVSM